MSNPAIAAAGRLKGKIAIVTGSSAGIGRAIALAFAREGAKVVCSDMHSSAKNLIGDEPPIATHDAIVKEGGHSIFVKADVGEAQEVEKLVEEAVTKFGRLDILVNNAGIAPEIDQTTATTVGQPIHLTPISTFDKTMRVNARGVFLGCKYATAQMMKQDLLSTGDRGWIINIASVAGLIGFTGCPSYCASKGAIVQLTRQVAVDYGSYKIHCNAICPGAITTAMVQPFSNNKILHDQLAAAHPWGVFGETKNVAKAAVFLASEDAGFITGALLPVDGGYVAQ